jgi:predicted RNA methylase
MIIDKLRLFKHFFASARKRGLSRTLRISAYEFWYDWHFGGKTGFVLPVTRLDYSADIRRHAQPYFPSSFLFLHEIFSHTGIECRDQVFIDLGSGTGRVLLFASRFPFRKLVGVEASRELCEAARMNMRRYYSRMDKEAPEWSIENVDVRDFQIPDRSGLVVYMYNPFDAAVLERVVDRVIESVFTQPRSCTVVYAKPVHESVLLSRGFSRDFAIDNDFAIYRFVDPRSRRVQCGLDATMAPLA